METEDQDPIKCDECVELFDSFDEFKNHKLSKHAKHVCDFCGITYRCRSSLIRHKQIAHRFKKTLARNTVICGECGAGLHSISELCDHLKTKHGFDTINVETFNFKNAKLFENWRKDVEKLGCFEFSCSNGARKFISYTKEYFYCHLSGLYNMQAKKISGSPKNSSETTGNDRPKYHCCAFAIVCYNSATGEVEVKACFQHYGQEIHLNRIRMDEESRNKIQDLLLQGKDTAEIVQIFNG